MIVVKIFLAFLLSIVTSVGSKTETNNFQKATFTSEFPTHTIFIKNPGAEDPATFFSANKLFEFEIYKAGSNEDLDKIAALFRKDTSVQSFTVGKLTGDFQAVSLVLKTVKNKEWFSTIFQKAGLNTIKINNKPVIEVSKM